MTPIVPSTPASAAVAELQRNAVDLVVTVSDWMQLSRHAQLRSGVPGTRVFNGCSENQCVKIDAALTIGGRQPLLMKQSQGLYDCLNTLRAVCMAAHVLQIFRVRQFGRGFTDRGRPGANQRDLRHGAGVPERSRAARRRTGVLELKQC